MITATRTPNVLYAQDKNSIFLTIDLQDVIEPKITTAANKVEFDAEKENVKYHFNIELFENVKEETWATHITNRNITFVVEKQVQGGKYWPRLQKAPGKLAFVKTDFSKYKDEDEDDEPENNQQDMNAQLAQMMAMQGQGGMPGMSPDIMKMMADAKAGASEQIDSDDEEEAQATS